MVHVSFVRCLGCHFRFKLCHRLPEQYQNLCSLPQRCGSVVAVAHLAKAAAKVSSWGGFLLLAVRDPQGIATLQGLTERTCSARPGMLALSMVGWATLALSLVMARKAWKWSKQVPAQYLAEAKTCLAGTAVLFGIVLTIWVWWPISWQQRLLRSPVIGLLGCG
jgi:hypothetical protein